jgi:hypothetical protein
MPQTGFTPIQLYRSATPSAKPADVDLAAGELAINTTDGNVFYKDSDGLVQTVNQKMVFNARNTSGSSIPKGTPVMFTGTVGASGKLTFGLAVANGSVPSEYMMGVTAETIANNDFGLVVAFGLIRGFNTSGSPYSQTWADGDLLYFDPATPGGWTNVEPVAPAIHVPVAVVVNAASGGAGSIFVRMEISKRLGDAQDVFINGTGSPLAGQVLIYDAAQGRWENGTLNVATQTTGTLTVARGGTGATSFTAQRLLRGDGTNAVTVGGVLDQSVAESMRITSAGSVGIGTTSPLARLDVVPTFSDGAACLRLGVERAWVFEQGGSGATARLELRTLTDIKNFRIVSEDKAVVVADFDVRNTGSVVSFINNVFSISATGAITSAVLADSVGFRGLPQNSRTSAYTLALADAGRHISITTGGVTIPANSAVAFPVGTTIVVYNNSASAQNIAITSDTLRLAGAATTGTRSLAQRGLVTLVKVAATEWVATGNVT